MRHAVWWVLVYAAGTGCVPPEVAFFTAPDDRHTTVATVHDTLRVHRFGPRDSTSVDGVALAFDVLDRARAEGRRREVDVIERVLAAVPDAHRVRGERVGEHNASILARLRRQSRVHQFDLTRADALVIRTVAPDTVRVEGPPPADDPLGDPVVEEWLVLVLTGDAVLDPNFGRRTEHEPSGNGRASRRGRPRT